MRTSEIKLSSKERLPLFFRHKPVSWFKRMIKLSRVCLALMGESRVTRGLAMEWTLGSVLTNNLRTRIQTILAMASLSTQKNTQRLFSSNAMLWSCLTSVGRQCFARVLASLNFAISTLATKVPYPKPSMARKTTWLHCHHRQVHQDAQTNSRNLKMNLTLTSP